MRKDVKAGLAVALVIVVVAGWYYTRDDASGKPIALGPDKVIPNTAETAKKTPEPARARRERTGERRTATSRPRSGEAGGAKGQVAAPGPGVSLTAERKEQRPQAPAGNAVNDAAEADAEAQSGPRDAGERTAVAAFEPLEYYTIQPGDTLAKLAEVYYGERAQAGLIMRANPLIRDPNRLPAGMMIVLPALPLEAGARKAPAVPAQTAAVQLTSPAPSTKERGKVAAQEPAKEAAQRSYTVRAGDSFYAIAKRELGSGERWPELLKLNHALVDGDPQRLRPGMKLILPEK